MFTYQPDYWTNPVYVGNNTKTFSQWLSYVEREFPVEFVQLIETKKNGEKDALFRTKHHNLPMWLKRILFKRTYDFETDNTIEFKRQDTIKVIHNLIAAVKSLRNNETATGDLDELIRKSEDLLGRL